MDTRTRAWLAAGFIGLIFLFVQLGALALVEPFKRAGYQAVENPQDPTNSVVYVVAILVATALMLAAIKFDLTRLIRAAIVLASVYLAWYVFSVLVPPVVAVDGFNVVALLATAALGIGLWTYPEWYVIDAAGAVMGAGAAGLFGISFGVLPALLLLVVLAVYDAISVYGTEHMLTLASGVMDLKVPVVLVIPLTTSYSFLDADLPDPVSGEPNAADDRGADSATEDDSAAAEESPADDVDADPLDRDALFVGLGDAVIPSVLVASAAFFAPASTPTLGVPGLVLTLPAAGAMLGTFLGLAILLWMVLKGRAHAGLPLLNGGAIAGYLLGAVISGMSLLEAVGLAGYL